MGNLPESRVQYERPFLKVGVDYAGPLVLKLEKGRCKKTFKAYIAIFVCLATKAVHIELVTDMTTEAFLGALRRFTARRGICTDIFSDNGTNFIGARTELKQYFMFLKENTNSISESLLRYQIKWHFITPSSPFQGGLWEICVKATKHHLKRVIGQQILTYEEMSTLLIEIEAILNSRPLCPISPDEIDALTPSHFLIGHPHTMIPEPDLRSIPTNRVSRWQMVKQMTQHFWQRWHVEYLTTLQRRSKWQLKRRNIQINDLVIIKDENLSPTKWAMARVIETHPGKDKLVRIVSLKTPNGIIKRPIQRLCILPFETDVSTRAGDVDIGLLQDGAAADGVNTL